MSRKYSLLVSVSLSDLNEKMVLEIHAAEGENVSVRQMGKAPRQIEMQADMLAYKSIPKDSLHRDHACNCLAISLTTGPLTENGISVQIEAESHQSKQQSSLMSKILLKTRDIFRFLHPIAGTLAGIFTIINLL